MWEGNVFSLSVNGGAGGTCLVAGPVADPVGGTLVPGLVGVPHPRSWGGGSTMVPGLVGCLIPGPGGGSTMVPGLGGTLTYGGAPP